MFLVVIYSILFHLVVTFLWNHPVESMNMIIVPLSCGFSFRTLECMICNNFFFVYYVYNWQHFDLFTLYLVHTETVKIRMLSKLAKLSYI